MATNPALDEYEDILADLVGIQHGQHDLIIYEDVKVFGKIYSKYCKHLLEVKNHAVLLIIFSEDEFTILDNLKHEGIDVDTRRKDGSLLIEDAALDFFGSKFGMLQYFLRLVDYSKTIKKDGLAIILDINALYLLDDEGGEELFKFENSIAEKDSEYLKDSSLLCCYSIAVVGKLQEKRQKIMDLHNKVFHGLP